MYRARAHLELREHVRKEQVHTLRERHRVFIGYTWANAARARSPAGQGEQEYTQDRDDSRREPRRANLAKETRPEFDDGTREFTVHDGITTAAVQYRRVTPTAHQC